MERIIALLFISIFFTGCNNSRNEEVSISEIDLKVDTLYDGYAISKLTKCNGWYIQGNFHFVKNDLSDTILLIYSKKTPEIWYNYISGKDPVTNSSFAAIKDIYKNEFVNSPMDLREDFFVTPPFFGNVFVTVDDTSSWPSVAYLIAPCSIIGVDGSKDQLFSETIDLQADTISYPSIIKDCMQRVREEFDNKDFMFVWKMANLNPNSGNTSALYNSFKKHPHFRSSYGILNEANVIRPNTDNFLYTD